MSWSLSVPAWKTYEEVATFLLDKFAHEFGLKNVEGKQLIEGRHSGTHWEIDGKGIREGGSGFIIVECRRHTTSRLKQEEIAAVAFRIDDSGAAGGIVVSPLGLQEGAQKVAAAANIVEVHLDENSTADVFLLSFLNRVMLGIVATAAQSHATVSHVLIKDPNGQV